MSNLNDAFYLPVNSENKYFVNNPYKPISSLIYPIKPNDFPYISTKPESLTKAKCFDIKYGSQNCYEPSYGKYQNVPYRGAVESLLPYGPFSPQG